MQHLLPGETTTSRLLLGAPDEAPADFGVPAPLQPAPTPRAFRDPGSLEPALQSSHAPPVPAPSEGPATQPPPPPAASPPQPAREPGRARGARDLPEASAAVGEGVSRTCVSARVRARVCPRACLAVRAEPGRTDSRGADGLSPWCGRRPRGGSGSRQSPSREAAPTRDPRSGGARRGRGAGARVSKGAWVCARGCARAGSPAALAGPVAAGFGTELEAGGAGRGEEEEEQRLQRSPGRREHGARPRQRRTRDAPPGGETSGLGVGGEPRTCLHLETRGRFW